MKKRMLLATLLAVFLFTAPGCETHKKQDPDQGCFAHAPLKTVPWAKAELANFQRPKSGRLRVVVYSYKNDYYLAFENLILSSPMSHIFDCSGKNIMQKGIPYNDFTADAQELKVLLDKLY
ncbi:hypothetical protein [Salmonirosea aquatica]|uniref:Lipoprotein n=1 Tax=Salmonirosea aquatica TaxID=2654236 RepID=A0A7C9BAG2_9BACT|nr:hypothetical protein [Cytophagaceae bacterium SJW1-29]